jgi:acetyl-CoA synthetase
MTLLTAYTTYADALAHFSPEKLWDLFDGDRDRLNIAHECIDRHAVDPQRQAVVIARLGVPDEVLTYREISVDSSRFANWLVKRGIVPGDRVAIMLEPNRAFYATLFGAIKAGAVAVPLFTLFGPDGVKLRVGDCTPKLIVTNSEKLDAVAAVQGVEVVIADDAFFEDLAGYSAEFEPSTSSRDMAIYQYTSGTTRELPEAVKHTHRSIVTLMVAALYGTGLRPGDKFFCPSSPAWGHGLWHGTLAPMALGLTVGAFAGRFNAEALLDALARHGFTNMSAAATHYRMMKVVEGHESRDYAIKKLSFTGEPMDQSTEEFVRQTFKTPACSMYGTTEIGVILVSYPGASDFDVHPGSLGKPIPGAQVRVVDVHDNPCPADVMGEIKVLRNERWIATKDLGRIDASGYFYHGGRADDVIISAGWTMSAVEIENAILKHQDVREAAAIGVPDSQRGQVVRAYVVSERPGTEAFTDEIQQMVRSGLSQHEYPRQVEFVRELPKTPAGKIHRKKLREAALMNSGQV